MDANQWSTLMDSTAVVLAIFSAVLGFYMYRKHRNDNAKDAYDYFQSSLPELMESIEEGIFDLKKFNEWLDLDNFVYPIISATLNDKFLSKINLVHSIDFTRKTESIS